MSSARGGKSSMDQSCGRESDRHELSLKRRATQGSRSGLAEQAPRWKRHPSSHWATTRINSPCVMCAEKKVLV